MKDGEWSITTKPHRCRRWDTDVVNTDATLNPLDGQKLVSIDYALETSEWIFEFDLGGVLRIGPSRPIDGPYLSPEIPGQLEGNDRILWRDADQWTLFIKGAGAISCSNAQIIFHEAPHA